VTSFAELHDLTGKVAVVTGGSRGIGRAIGTAGPLVASAGQLPYACAKAGLNALTLHLASDGTVTIVAS
jgi:NAD(P)-dependent dehydrogenase (short-subunit alcohol dehydrogenase family)